MEFRIRGSTWALCGIVAMTLMLGGGMSPEILASPAQGKPGGEDPFQRTLNEGQKLIDEGKYAEAESLERKLLSQIETKYGPLTVETARVLDVLVAALLRGGKAGEVEAKALAERAVRIKEKILGQDDPELAKSVNNLAYLLSSRGDFAGAKLNHERALAIREKAFGPDSPEVARSLSALGEVLRNLGKYAEAKPLHERALAIQEKALGLDHPDVATGLNNLATIEFEMGHYAEARQHFERALAIREKVLGSDHPDISETLGNLAVVLYQTGDYAGARTAYQRARAIDEKSLGPDHPYVAGDLNNEGMLLNTLGQYTEARPLLERALAIREKSLGPEHPDVAISLSNMADLLRAMGDYASARPLLERALAIREKVLGPDHPDVAFSLAGLGSLLYETGDYAAASVYFGRALALKESRVGPDHPQVAALLNNLGNARRGAGDLVEAKRLHERALAIREKALGPDHSDVANSLSNLAAVLSEMGEFASSLELSRRALAITEKSFGPDHPTVATRLNNMANRLWEMGDLAAAKQLFERALSIREKTLVPEHPDLALNLHNLASVSLQLGDKDAALRASIRSQEIGTNHLRLIARTLTERRALLYASIRPHGLGPALSALASAQKPDPLINTEVWDALIHSRALILDEMGLRRRAILGQGESDVARLAGNLKSASTHLANLVVRGPGKDPLEQYNGMIERARLEKEQAEQALAEKSATFREELSRERVGWEEVVNSLPKGTALVAFALYPEIQWPVARQNAMSASAGDVAKEPAVGKPKPVPSYMAFVLAGRTKNPVSVPLGPAAEIDALVYRWQKEVSRGIVLPGRTPEDAESVYRDEAAALRRRVWDPVVPLLKGVRGVFVVPDGALNLVNLAAMPSGDGRYIIETGPLVHYLSAERDLSLPGVQGPQGTGLLAVGAPDFDATGFFASLGSAPAKVTSDVVGELFPSPFRGERSACSDFRSMQFKTLPAAGQEVSEVVSLWNKASRTTLERASPGQVLVEQRGSVAVQLLGAAASESAFKIQAPGKRVLHLATHGFFLGGNCFSALEPARGIGGLVATPDLLPPPVGENPLLLSGLALAGANHRDAAGRDEDDGILTAEEIAAMDLSGVEWAVLSACDTGVGEVRAGEGVFGLRRAFQVAGSRTLIMSLWPVDDEATRRWMEALYEGRLGKRLSTAVAVRDASLKVLRERRSAGLSTHPFYWAAFVAAGDWR